MTTHSPHIVSVSPVRSLVLLRRSSNASGTIGVATSALDLSLREEADLERYLDVSRGEIVFARGVLLVEGEAETYLLPAVGRLFNYDFDKLGISVCSVAGTNFEPYLKLVGPAGLNLPYAVLTDHDPQADGRRLGRERARRLYPLVAAGNDTPTECPEIGHANFIASVAARGIFVNDYTLEVDMFRGGQHAAVADTLTELSENGACRDRAASWRNAPETMEPIQMLKDIAEIGKGRFAQRLASCLSGAGCPDYIKDAIAFVAAQCD